MSLQLVAKHLAEKGRGPDSTLVHMSNREVSGLNALAQKHGGQLSVNPETGLPEAGFLDNILPAIAGAGISYLSNGAIDPLSAAGIVGGITALDSKDLSKGLVAGLGAYGGAGMVGGLAGLGAAGADTAAMATPEYQSAVGTGASNFMKAPMASLSTLGGGSALKGSLPILAGLAPAAAEAFDEEEDDGAPKQHQGYIRKYAFDPITGQYKQVGAYEAGGDPSVDVSSKAGTAGSYGGVGRSEYEAAHGMADGGVATSDSQRVYDYLMGRGPNPMQFTHTTAPQVDYNINKPITPTTPILEAPFDQYGNIQKTGGGYDREQREAYMNEIMHDYGDGTMTRNQYWSKTPEERSALDARFAQEHPIKSGIADFVKTAIMPGGLASKILGTFVGGSMKDPRPFADIPGNEQYVKTVSDFGGNFYTPSLGGAEAGRTVTPAQQAANDASAQAARNEINNADRIAAFDASRDHAGGGGGMGEGNSLSRDTSGESGAAGATGGLSTPYGFQHMAHGGIANLHQYNLGSYSDGGRLLKGPGDGVSDDIPATIGSGQPARLADGEFVIPARIVSELGNGSTDAGARALYQMMDRIQAGRKKTVGKDQVAKNSKAVRHLPA